MPFGAQVVRVLIASPSDTAGPRQVIKETIEEWNSLHAENSGVVALPVMWERDATPEMGERPQGIINRRLVDIADVLIGAFWTRLGTPTGEAESGTVEEIDRFIEAGKPVLLYFSSEPVVPESIDQEEYKRLASFREDVRAHGLVDGFGTLDELRWKSMKALTVTIRDRLKLAVVEGSEPPSAGSAPRAALVAHIDRERELRGVDNKGRPKYSTRERLAIENRGTAAAEQVLLAFELPEGEEGRLPTIVAPDGPLGRVPPGASIDLPLMRAFGTASRWDVVYSWTENGEQFDDRQTVF